MAAPSLTIDVPADPAYLKCIRGFLKPILEEKCTEEETRQLVLAIDEACSNIIKHGQSWLRPKGRIMVDFTDGKKKLVVRILNFCKESEVAKIKPRDLEDVRPGGLGTHFMREVMDEVEFEPDENKPGRMALVMTKNISGKTDDNEAQG